MLSYFDLSLRCAVSPTLIRTSTLDLDPKKEELHSVYTRHVVSPRHHAFSLHASFPESFHRKVRKNLESPELGLPSSVLLELVAEPTAARSMSFVGTHEYLAPEIIKGEAHGSAVDWWTFGVFLHELLYGKTSFKGLGNQVTLFNVIGQRLKFPDSPATSYASRDLIPGLLVKQPQRRFGMKRGATEIKQHPFFEGVNWALMRCSTPPEVPRPIEAELPVKFGRVEPVGAGSSGKRAVGKDMKSEGRYLDFEFF